MVQGGKRGWYYFVGPNGTRFHKAKLKKQGGKQLPVRARNMRLRGKKE